MKAVNVNDVLKILHKYGKYIFVTDEKKYSSMVDEIANLKALEQESCDDAVSRGVFNQVMWERDTAIEQLRKLGYELGQKIEPCDDCVSRQAVIVEIRNLYPDIPFADFNNARLKWTRKYKPYLDCEEVVKGMPSVLPKHEENTVSEEVYTEEHIQRQKLEYELYVLKKKISELI